MNCVSINAVRREPRAFTFLEMLIAVAIFSVFLGGIYVTYNQMLQVNKRAMANLEAQRNGRAALLSLGDEFKTLNDFGGHGLLIAPDVPPLSYGDGIDNNGDGPTDEGVVNGLNDSSTSGTLQSPAHDRHAVLDPINDLRERPMRVGFVDLGDANVDVDCKFGQDFIIFQETPEAPSDIILKVITYAIPPAGFEGQKNVLVRQTRIERVNLADPTGAPLVEGGQAPIAFGVLGFDLLFWDSNVPPDKQIWLTAWDSTQKTGLRFHLPASVYIRLTLNADPRPAEILVPGKPVQTLVLATVVDIESVIGSPLFERPVLP